jgi:hypothetical protein
MRLLLKSVDELSAKDKAVYEQEKKKLYDQLNQRLEKMRLDQIRMLAERDFRKEYAEKKGVKDANP